MTLQEALDALGYPPKRSINVTTKSGAQYEVELDVIENCEGNADWVYGFRTNSTTPDAMLYRRKRMPQKNGALRWFALKNIKLSTTE
jgi:hypothetical protein